MSEPNGNGDGGSNGSHRDDLERASGGPLRPITDSLAKPLARRFYKNASAGDTPPYRVLLDGRPLRTPKKRFLEVPARALAEAIAAEWQAQGEKIDPSQMPLTRFANSAIDAVADTLSPVAADIVAYAGSDLVCYRAEAPDTLVRMQSEHWNPVVAWADKTLRTRFRVVPGIVHARQPEDALAAVARALEPLEPFRLTGLHILTTLTGSALLTLDLAQGGITADAAWTAAHVDEDYQISLWGEDAEAAARRRNRRAEFDAAVSWLALLAPRT